MESARGTIAVIVFSLILAIAGIVFVLGGSKAESRRPDPAPSPTDSVANAPAPPRPAPEKAPEPAPAPAPVAPPAPAVPVAQAQADPPARRQPDVEVGEKNPALVVPPVDEPDMPLDMKAGEKFGYYAAIANDGGFVYEYADSKGKVQRGIVVPGKVIVRRGIVELFGCGEGGKEHETIVRVESDVQSLDLALGMAGFKRGALPKELDIDLPNQGSRVVVLVQWSDPLTGKPVTYRSEDLIVSIRHGKPMPRVGWTYVGEWTELPEPGADEEPPANPSGSGSGSGRNRVLSAASSRSILTTFRDRTALLDCPLKDAEDDTNFAANYMILPGVGTPVRVIFRAPSEEEKAEISKVEKELAKQQDK